MASSAFLRFFAILKKRWCFKVIVCSFRYDCRTKITGGKVLNTRKIETHKELCDFLHSLYVKKNADYGDSYAKVRREYPNAILIRLSDKFERLKTLLNNNEQKVSDESVQDTFLDLANYCLLECVERTEDLTKVKK